jgi:cytochrome d ubiquinol oxidase subunit I
MDMDPVLLARLQFAFTIVFHIIFPSFTIGLAAFIATLLVRWRLTGRDHLHRLARFWTRIFAVSFAMGVVSGIVLSYQLGTNWSRFSVVTGNVIGPLLGYEVLTAFFLEATFLGIMLFGWKRVSPNVHTLSAVLVAVGTSLSAFWILAANSWMHTPTGHVVRDGIAYPVDWLEIIFNPSFPYRFSHMFTAAFLTTSLVILAVGARYRMAGRFNAEARTMMRMGLGMVALLAPLQLVIGDLHGLNTLEHQPVKVAAMEAHWDGSQPADLVLFAYPDEAAETNRWALSIPKGASLILTHDPDGKVRGLKDFPPSERPPVLPVFFAFRVMVALGLAMIAIGIIGVVLWVRGRLFDARWFLKPVQHTWPFGFIAILAGWWVTETGRQPWIAHGILRTADAASPVSAASVLTSLILFVVIYTVMFAMGLYYINRLIVKGPEGPEPERQDGVASRPMAAATDATRHATGGED